MQSREKYINIFKELGIQESILDPLSALFCDSKELKANDVVKLLCSVNDNNLALKCAQIISEALKINQTILKIDFCCTIDISREWTQIYIGHAGTQFIAEMLKVNTAVREVDLSRNEIGDLGAQYLADALKHNRNVQRINLSSNRIQTNGFKCLAEMLEITQTLQLIDLGDQNPGDEGIKYLATALNNNPEIPTIRMWQCDMGNKGLKQLMDTFDNKPIQYFVKQASIFRGLKVQIGYCGGYGGVSEEVDSLPLTQKIVFWNRKVECYHKFFF